MMSKAFRHEMRLFLALMMSAALTCCFDYDTVSADQKGDSIEDFSLAFDISLNTIPEGTTRADGNEYGDDVDNEVDVEGKNHDFRVLLFDKDDNFLYEPENREIEPIDNDDYEDTGVQTKRWRITMPIMALKRRGLWENIASDNFKIAVLANWPRSADNPLEFKAGDKLYKLSHYWTDNVYAGTASDAQKEAYSFLSDANGKMGAYIEWVKNTYSKQEDAAKAIRENARDKDVEIYQVKREVGTYKHIYKHIWRIWNFGNDDLVEEITSQISFQNFWKSKRNEEELSKINSATGLNNYSPIYDNGDDGLSFESGSDGNSYDKTNHCIKIKKLLNNATHSDGTGELSKDFFSFNAYAAGTLVVWAKRNNSSETPYIGIQKGKFDGADKRKSNRNKDAKEQFQMTDEVGRYEFSVSVTGTNNNNIPGDPVPVYVYAVDGDVSIYQIEYLEDDHLYNTDREGYLPGDDKNGQLIPMYGVQEFSAIGSYFKNGETFNLSTAPTGENDGYTRKKVHLLRSVAKVELLIPTTFPKLTHAYLRCANRHSRCEPIDVLTPTDILWNGGIYRNINYFNIDQEIEYIRNYGPFYDSSTSDYAKYRSKLSWFYKAWEGLGSNWTANSGVWKKDDITTTVATEENYPHIFNTRINRSDYTHFRYMGQRGLYNRYVLYVPEKNIDDPNSHGKMNSTPPKIPHIELRFDKDDTFNGNDDTNLDDNDCYRIYFTPDNKDIPAKDGNYDNEELKHLAKFYPIVRNHIYRFTLSGFNRDNIEINVNVTNTPIPTDWTTNEWGYTYEP